MRFLYLLLFSVTLFSCKLKEKPALEKVWFYKDDLTREEQVENVYKYGSTVEYGFTAASFLNLQPNGKFTSYFSAFDYGNWKLQDSTLVLTDHNKGKLLLNVKKLGTTQMVCINESNHKVYWFMVLKMKCLPMLKVRFQLTIIYGE